MPGPGHYQRTSDFNETKPLAKINPVRRKSVTLNADLGPTTYNINRDIQKNNNVKKTFGKATRTFLLQEGVERCDDTKKAPVSKEVAESQSLLASLTNVSTRYRAIHQGSRSLNQRA